MINGPVDAWYLVNAARERNGDAFPRPIFVRPALRTEDTRDAWDKFVDRVGDWLYEYHPLDFAPLRKAYRLTRWTLRWCDIQFWGQPIDWPSA